MPGAKKRAGQSGDKAVESYLTAPTGKPRERKPNGKAPSVHLGDVGSTPATLTYRVKS